MLFRSVARSAGCFMAIQMEAGHQCPITMTNAAVATLLLEPDSGLLTMLLQMAPGAKLPDHEHVLIEQTWVLQGSLVCGEGVCKAGDFVWRPAGSRHEAWAGPEGGLMLGIFQIPNRFFQADGKVVDFAGNAWEPIWADALARQEQARFDAN